MDPYAYRKQDYALDEDQESVREAFADFFAKEVPSTRVREVESLGFDEALWEAVVGLGLTSMAIPENHGGDGAGMVELVLAAEEIGRVLAPVPIIEHMVATRLLAAANDPAHVDLLQAAVAGERMVGFSPRTFAGRQIASHGAVTKEIVGYHEGRLVLISTATNRAHISNQASLPYAWVDPGVEQVTQIAAPDPRALFEVAGREWRVLTASALTGLTEASLGIGVEFAKTRETMGTFIGKLQGVQFPLVDVHMWTTGSRNLVRRAAWFMENEPDKEQALPYEAFAYAADMAAKGTSIAAHVQGGLGFIAESDASLYFLRSKGWAAGAGDPAESLREAGRLVLEDHRRKRAAESVVA